ncbi:MAG: META domain-containing protein [Caulobacterales bacterium]
MKAILLAGVMMVAACASAGAPSASPLPSGEWRLTSLNGQAPGAERKPTIQFGEQEGVERAGGFAGCNRWFGTVSREGSATTISSVGATRMFCEGAMDLEQSYLETLGKTAAIETSPGALILKDASGVEIARFERVS